MKKMIRLLALTLALMLCMLPVLAETSADDVLATVNGEPVTRADYEEMLANLNDEYGASYDMSNEMIAAMFRQIAMEYAVNYAAEEAMLKDIIAQNNLQLTEEELKDQGIFAGTIRLSIGTEHIDDIIADLSVAFRKDCQLSDNIAACGFDEFFHSAE